MQEMPSATKLNGINRLAYTAPDKAPGTRTAAAYLELHQTFSPLFFYLGLWEGRGGGLVSFLCFGRVPTAQPTKKIKT